MKASTPNDWTRAVHEHLVARSTERRERVGMTAAEAVEAVGPPPKVKGTASAILQRAARRGWFDGERESAARQAWGGSQVRVRYFAVGTLPAETAQRAGSYFDGLVRANSVFELAQIVGQAGADA